MRSLTFPRIGRCVGICASTLALVSAAACSDDATGPRSAAPPASAAVDAPNLGLGTSVSPVIDGIMGPGEYTDADTTTFRIALPSPYGGTMVTLYAKRDKTNLYLATVYDRKSPVLIDQVVFEFDNDNDGVREDADDMIGTNSSQPINLPLDVMDMFRTNGGASSNHDELAGGVRNVMSAWGTVGNTVTFEITHALNSSDDAHDFSIDATSGPVTLGMQTMMSIQVDPPNFGWVHSYYPSPTGYCKLTIFKKTVNLAC